MIRCDKNASNHATCHNYRSGKNLRLISCAGNAAHLVIVWDEKAKRVIDVLDTQAQ